jgi:hypothetical protein
MTRKSTNVLLTHRRATLQRAPYISFASVLRVLEAFRASWSRGGDARQFIEKMDKASATHRIAALRFLGLLDADCVPTPALTSVLGAIGTAAWSDTLALTIRTAFRPILACDLANLTLTQFATAFAQHYTGSEAVLRKSRTFFVHAAIQAKIPLSPGLVHAAKPRAGDRVAAPRRTEHRSVAVRGGNRDGSRADDVNPMELPPSLAVRLLSELDTHAMDDNVRWAFWTLLRHIKDQEL